MHVNSPVDRFKQVSYPRRDKSNWRDDYSKKKIIKGMNKLWVSNEKKYCHVYTLIHRMILFYWGEFFLTSPSNPDHANGHWQSTGNRCYSQMASNLELVNLCSGGYISLKVFYSQSLFLFYSVMDEQLHTLCYYFN